MNAAIDLPFLPPPDIVLDLPAPLSVNRTRRRWRRMTGADLARIREFYETTPPETFRLETLAVELGRTVPLISRHAKALGLTIGNRSGSTKARGKISAAAVLRLQTKGHPRGMLGKKHSPEFSQRQSQRVKKMWATDKAFGIGLMSEESREKRRLRISASASSRPASKAFSRSLGGHRDDLGGVYFRSSWEANYARYLNVLIRLGVVEKWDFEPEVFWFDGIKRGVTNYRPDFRIKYKGDDRLEYVEIKGWVTPKDRTKWQRMKKYHPQIKLVIVGAKQYYALRRKWAASIPTWESPKNIRPIEACPAPIRTGEAA